MKLLSYFSDKRIQRVVELAEKIYLLAKQAPAARARIEADPDAALEKALEIAMAQTGVDLNAKEVRRAIGKLALVTALEKDLAPRAQKLVAYIDSLEAKRR